MKYFKKINGDSVYLSPVNSEDFVIYTKWLNNLNTTQYMGNSSMNVSLSSEKAFLENMAKQDTSFAIVLHKDDRLIGNASLYEVNHINRTAKIGLFIGEEEDRGKGYGTEVLHLLLNYGIRILNLNNIMLHVFAFNHRAIRSYLKVGFKEIGRRSQAYFLDGKYHDEVFMEILADNYQSIEIIKK